MLDLPDRPERLAETDVAAWAEPVTIPSYLPEPASRYPAYLDRRVYQGSSGRVYPLPFHDRIAESPSPHRWQGLHLENAYLRVLVLPELGGRVQLAIDKRTGASMFYANPVIKPALVGLTGPWLAGGIEFNWPQHHRPATFLPTAWTIDDEPDDTGEQATVWCSDHDPFARMKGMHGIRLRPHSTVIELAVRLYNRSELPQTFLWWANAAVEVHADYQSFFPADVRVVADHAKRALSTFPAASGTYYGVDYPARRAADTRPDSPRRVPGDRLDWYRNIPVPTSYMGLDSAGDFFGGYDHLAQAGFVHWADHHVAVGKKQWSWGDSPFGHAWNANLTDDDSAYVELMAGVYSDNQPDFSHLAPGETKSFSQYWYPVARTGPAVTATREAALGVEVRDESTILRWDVTGELRGAALSVVDLRSETLMDEVVATMSPEQPRELSVPTVGPVRVELRQADRTVLSWQSESPPATVGPRPEPATAPPAPDQVDTVEELHLIGSHLRQYRHATRAPEPYWREALRRDPGHVPSHVALAAQCYRRGDYSGAERHLRPATERLTRWNPNPPDGEACYLLGLTLVQLGRDEEAYAILARAIWVRAWAGPAGYRLAALDACAGRNDQALSRVEAALRAEPEHLQARSLRVVLLRRLGRTAQAQVALAELLRLDPLDVWALHLAGRLDRERGLLEAQTLVDVALDAARIGADEQAVELLELAYRGDRDRPRGQTGCGILADYHRADALERLGDAAGAAAARERARLGDRTGNFPSRLEDVTTLRHRVDADPTDADPSDATAAALLGHWCYAHDRPDDALTYWRASTAADPTDPVVWRNLGIALANHQGDHPAATGAYERALALAPGDAQLWFESDQLRRRAGVAPTLRLERLADLERLQDGSAPVDARDDLCVEYGHLLVCAGRPFEALRLLQQHRFQPWEGGEGQALGVWERTQLALVDRALRGGDAPAALAHAEAAVDVPEHLGERRHPLASPARALLALGDAAHAGGKDDLAQDSWEAAARRVGDFTGMAPQAFGVNTYYSVLAARAAGDHDLAGRLSADLAEYVERLAATPASVDYFATSLPTALLFDEDPQLDQDRTVQLLRAQLALLADDATSAHAELAAVLDTEPGHHLAVDLAHRLDQTEHRG